MAGGGGRRALNGRGTHRSLLGFRLAQHVLFPLLLCPRPLSAPTWKATCWCRTGATAGVRSGRGVCGVDPKPAKRIVDGTAEPVDAAPTDGALFCPLCGMFVEQLQRCHVVGRGQGGDDVPDNLFWACELCHSYLPPQGEKASEAAYALVLYARRDVPELGSYADRKKYLYWLEERYLGQVPF